MRASRGLWGRTRNGLSWRIGLLIVATLQLARHRQGTHADTILLCCAHRLRDPLLGGSNGPAMDASFQVAGYYARARVVRTMS